VYSAYSLDLCALSWQFQIVPIVWRSLLSHLPGFCKNFARFLRSKFQTVPPSQTRQIRLQTHIPNRPKRSLGTLPESQKRQQNAAWDGGTRKMSGPGGEKVFGLLSGSSLAFPIFCESGNAVRSLARFQKYKNIGKHGIVTLPGMQKPRQNAGCHAWQASKPPPGGGILDLCVLWCSLVAKSSGRICGFVTTC